MGAGINILVGLAAKESISEVKDVKPGGTVIYDTSIPGDIEKEDSLAALGALSYWELLLPGKGR
jgi:Pyruvate/2-oxoacid:ferredoxin oxidoreductase gamma subunit